MRGYLLIPLILIIPLISLIIHFIRSSTNLPIHQLQLHHLRSIPVTQSQGNHACVTGGTLGVAVFEELDDLLAGIAMRDVGIDGTDGVAGILGLRDRDDLLDERLHNLGALLGRSDRFVEKHRGHQIPLHGPAVRRFVTEPEAGDAVTHDW